MSLVLSENLVDYDPFDDDAVNVIDADFDPFDNDDDVQNSDNHQYLESDVTAALEVCKLIPENDIREMLARGETVKSIIAADRAAWAQYNDDIKTADRDFKESWEQQNDGYDIVDVAHAAGVALSDFDNIARRLGMGWNWSENAQKRRDYKEKKIARRVKAREYVKAEKFTPDETGAPRKSTLIVTGETKKILRKSHKIIIPQIHGVKIPRFVTMETLPDHAAKLATSPANRKRPGAPRMWHKAGAVRW